MSSILSGSAPLEYVQDIRTRLFHRLDLELDPPHYTLATKTAPTPGPSMKFKVRVKGYRNAG